MFAFGAFAPRRRARDAIVLGNPGFQCVRVVATFALDAASHQTHSTRVEQGYSPATNRGQLALGTGTIDCPDSDDDLDRHG